MNLNVCLINDSFPPLIDGVANTVVNYGSIINASLGRASVATPYYPDAEDEKFGFPVIRFPSIDTTKLVGYRTGFPMDPGVLERLQGEHFNIIHSHCPVASTFLARALRNSCDIPIVLTYHTKFDIDIRNSIKGGLLQEGAIRALVSNVSACDEIWTVSRGAGENLKSLGFEGDYIVMPNGVDFPRGRTSGDKMNEACKGFDLPEDVPCFLFVGRIMWYKGLRIILDSLKMLSDTGRDFRMVFIGRGGDKAEVTAYSERLGLEDKVFFHEPVYDRELLRAWYSRADLFIFPSTFDTNGLVVREAAACSLASVLVRGSCAAEDTIDGKNCLWIDENAESLYTLLTEKGYDRALLKRLGEQALEDLYCSWEESVKNAYERYGVVIDKYRSGEYAAQRKERMHTLDSAFDALFKLSADSLQDFVEMERELGKISLKAASELKELRADYRELENDFRIELKEHIENIIKHIERQ